MILKISLKKLNNKGVLKIYKQKDQMNSREITFLLKRLN